MFVFFRVSSLICLYNDCPQEVETHYSVANGYDHDAQVIYGDTDSVMVKFGTNKLEEAMRLGSYLF